MIDLGPAQAFLDASQAIVERIRTTQLEPIGRAAELCATSIAAGGLVHAFGTGHSRIPVLNDYVIDWIEENTTYLA